MGGAARGVVGVFRGAGGVAVEAGELARGAGRAAGGVEKSCQQFVVLAELARTRSQLVLITARKLNACGCTVCALLKAAHNKRTPAVSLNFPAQRMSQTFKGARGSPWRFYVSHYFLAKEDKSYGNP
jgi:hypothetical protein